MSKRRDVYILMRVYFGGYKYDKKNCIIENAGFDSDKYYLDLKRAISSIENNKSWLFDEFVLY